MLQLLAVFIGGGLGSLARFGISKLTLQYWSSQFPLGTLIANVFSCVVLGFAIFLLQDKLTHTFWRFLIIIGFCGGFSTFSTFSYETLELLKTGNSIYAAANILANLVLCIFVLALFTKQA